MHGPQRAGSTERTIQSNRRKTWKTWKTWKTCSTHASMERARLGYRPKDHQRKKHEYRI